MMWPLMADLMWASNLETSKILSESSSINVELGNILVMTSVALTMNHLMNAKDTQKYEKIITVIMMVVGGMVILSFVSDSSMMYLVMMEMTVMPLAYLIITTSKDSDKLESIKFMVMMNTAGSVPFMVFSSWGEDVLKQEIAPFSLAVKAGMVMMMLLFLVKTPMFLVHAWLTKAHVAASGNCSMLLASIMIKLGTVGMMKFYKFFQKEKMFYILSSLCLMSSFYLTWVMFRFFDSKTLIAMSSILHMSMLIPMMMMKKSISMISSVMMMTAHGVISYYLFYLITQKYEMTESRTSLTMKSMESSDKTFSLLMVTFLFLNLGIPPLMNFISECSFLISMSMLNSWSAKTVLALILLVSVMFTMQMTVNTLYGETKSRTKKYTPTAMVVKSTFYFLWAGLVMMAM